MKTEKTQHTPAPWSINGFQIRKDNGVPIILATVYKHLESNQSRAEAEANAQLIASAPELLEALKNLVTAISPAYNFDLRKAGEPVQTALQAIAKAEGKDSATF